MNALLNVSRIESGRIIINPKPTDMKPILESLVKELEVLTKEKDIEVALKIDSNLGKVNIDGRLVREVYKNFLTNAVKYTPKVVK